ncbi:hypothetical protein DFS34DRAFT_668581 [Phlyctochytrium arcticum]|nr:hypothetical protein DFS34DRAFT_668581 [Phlyctochytrium arcticum]
MPDIGFLSNFCRHWQKFELLRCKLLPWPDSILIGLNGQEALLKWNSGILMPIWAAAFPNFAITVVNMILAGGIACRDEVFNSIKRANHLTPVQRVMAESVLRLFEEEIPLVCHAPVLMAEPHKDHFARFEEVARHLLPLFIRYRKKNYVTIISHILGCLHYFANAAGTEGSDKMDQQIYQGLKDMLPSLTSEDLEVFFSVLLYVQSHPLTMWNRSKPSTQVLAKMTPPLGSWRGRLDVQNNSTCPSSSLITHKPLLAHPLQVEFRGVD